MLQRSSPCLTEFNFCLLPLCSINDFIPSPSLFLCLFTIASLAHSRWPCFVRLPLLYLYKVQTLFPFSFSLSKFLSIGENATFVVYSNHLDNHIHTAESTDIVWRILISILLTPPVFRICPDSIEMDMSKKRELRQWEIVRIVVITHTNTSHHIQ